MSIRIGMHAGPQDLGIEELKRLWQFGDSNGFHWISVWDHFYANPLKDRNNPCFEGVAAMSALATLTSNVRVGCLVFCALFRNPAILAKAAVTIDHLSGGRADIGIGAGWLEEEFREFGYGFPPLGKRLDQLEEALAIVRSLLHEEVTNFSGEYYQIENAVCAPKPVGKLLPIWVGGRGKTRTPRIAAKYADGFNMPYLSPEAVADRLERLNAACEAEDRDPAELATSVNVGFYLGDREPDVSAAGSLVGSSQQAVDRIGEYQRTGVGGLNIALRPPVDWVGLQRFVEEVMAHFRD